MLMLSFLFAAAAPPPAMPATTARSRAAITAYIRACEAVWARSSLSDMSRQTTMFIADDYRGVSSRGKVLGKREVTAFAPPAYKAAALYYAKVRFYTPVVAVAQGEEWDEPGDGAAKQHRIWIDTWLFRAGAWRIVASQDSSIPFDQPLQDKAP